MSQVPPSSHSLSSGDEESTGAIAEPERYVREIVATAQRLLGDKAGLGDLKIINAALREMRYAFRVFKAYRHIRKISIFGSARTASHAAAFKQAEAFASRMADAGFMIITGAGPGIMEACQRGAGRERSFGINIRLPFEQSANPIITGDQKLVNFKYFFTRKLFFVKEADGVALFPGGFGTHDEGFEVLTLMQTGKSKLMPVVFLDQPRGTYWRTWKRYVIEHILRQRMISEEDLALFLVTQDLDEAVEEMTAFYRVYHSSRYVRDQLVIRLNRPLPPEAVAALNRDFGDILVKGKIVQRSAFSAERTDAEIFSLPRLALHFNRTNFGRLRMLINRINQL